MDGSFRAGAGETANICQSYLGGLFLLSVTTLHWAITEVKWGTRLIYISTGKLKLSLEFTTLN